MIQDRVELLDLTRNDLMKRNGMKTSLNQQANRTDKIHVGKGILDSNLFPIEVGYEYIKFSFDFPLYQ